MYRVDSSAVYKFASNNLFMGKVSMETAHQLHNQMRIQIPEFERTADRCATILLAINAEPETDTAIALKAVSETLLMLCYINLDLMTA